MHRANCLAAMAAVVVFAQLARADWPNQKSDKMDDMIYPPTHPFHGQSIDLAFALTTVPEPGCVLLLLGSGCVLAARRQR